MPVLRQKLLTDFYCSSEKIHEPEPVPSISGEPELLANVDAPESTNGEVGSPMSAVHEQSSTYSTGSSKVVRRTVLLGKGNRKRGRTSLDESKQLILDAGQKIIGHQLCRDCGMLYDCDSLSDRKHHDRFHNRFTSTEWFRVRIPQLEAWRKSAFCIVEHSKGSYNYVFCVLQTTKSSLKARTEKVFLECVNKELGYSPDLADVWTKDCRRQAWVFITSLDSYYFIGAVVLVENKNDSALLESCGSIHMGINRLWVHRCLRRKGIGALLLDHARAYFTGSEMVPREKVAFSSPTESGLAFAKSYVPDGKVLLYALAPL